MNLIFRQEENSTQKIIDIRMSEALSNKNSVLPKNLEFSLIEYRMINMNLGRGNN